MPVDTSIYGNLLKPPPTALESASVIQGLVNSGLQAQQLRTNNAILQQEYQANAAMGPIMQQSVGPDGQVDYGKAATLMAQNPATAYKAPDFLAKAYQGQGQQLKNQLDKLDIFARTQKIFGDAAVSVVAEKGDNITSADVARRLDLTHGELVAAGLDTDGKYADQMISLMSHLPAQSGPPLKDFVQSLGIQANGAADGLNRLTGSFQIQNIGGKNMIIQTDPLHRSYQVIGEIANTPTVPEMNAPVSSKVTNPQASNYGATIEQPRIDAMQMVDGAGRPINAQPQGAPPLNVPPPQLPPGAPQAGPGTPPAGPLAPAPQAAAPHPPGAITTALSPEAQGILDMRAKNAAEYSKQLQLDVGTAQNQVLMLQQLEDLSKEFKPGAGASVRNQLAMVMQGLGMPTDAIKAVDNGSMTATQAFQKYGVQNTMNVLRQSIGGQGRLTNLEFEQFLKSNPNIDTDPGAIERILGFAHKLYSLKFAEQQGFNDYVKRGPQHGGGLPADFQGDWIKKMMARGIIRPAQATDLSQQSQLKFGGK